ncbi:MAG: sel1 repeat family protein [Rhodospirillales bacterium]|nr:sel1 repeat family protein [Rhodospirillales bacterium]
MSKFVPATFTPLRSALRLGGLAVFAALVLSAPAQVMAGPAVATDLTLSAEHERAANGDANAMFDLGVHYTDGKAVARDPIEAYLWFNRAVGAGHPEAANARLRLEYIMTTGEIAKARAFAIGKTLDDHSYSDPS